MTTTSTKSHEELRFVTSVEQMAPFLEHLHEAEADRRESDFDEDDIEVQQYSAMNEAVAREMHAEDANANGLGFVATIAMPPPTTALVTIAAFAIPNIYEEYVNFIDLSVLNPIVHASECQKDVLIESEISELMGFYFTT